MPDKPEKLTINKSTGITLGVVLVIIGATVWITNVAAKADGNEKDISVIVTKLDAEIEARRDLNESIVALTGRLDGFNNRLDDFDMRLDGVSQRSQSVTLTVSSSPPSAHTLLVQPEQREQTVKPQPSQPSQPPKEDPAPDPQPTFLGQVQMLPCNLLNVLCQE